MILFILFMQVVSSAHAFDADAICPVGLTYNGVSTTNLDCPCAPMPGNIVRYEMATTYWSKWGNAISTNNWERQIQEGASAWNSIGPAASSLNSMAIWAYLYDGRASAGQTTFGDGSPAVWKSRAYMWFLGETTTHAYTLNWYSSCSNKTSFDIIFNDEFVEPNSEPGDGSFTRYWSMLVPSIDQGAWHNETHSVQIVAAHEFGHGLGLSHFNQLPAIMNEFPSPNFAGDSGQLDLHGNFVQIHAVRLQEDDALGLAHQKPATWMRRNLMASLSDSYNSRFSTDVPGQAVGVSSLYGADLSINTEARFCAISEGNVIASESTYGEETAAILITDSFMYPATGYPLRFIEYSWELVTQRIPKYQDGSTPNQTVRHIESGVRAVRFDGVRTFVDAPTRFEEVGEGSYYLRFCVDTANQVSEVSEDDNCVFSRLASFTALSSQEPPCN